MADAENLGTYHDLFFKLQGTKETEDEYKELTDSKKIDQIRDVYAAWVEKYIDVDENTPPENEQEAAEESYFDKREEEVAKIPSENTDKDGSKIAEQRKLRDEYARAGWKEMEISITLPDGSKSTKEVHYNPEGSDYKGLSEDELKDKLSEEYAKKHPIDDKEDENKKEDEALIVTDKDDKDDKDSQPQPQEENQDWIADEEKYWRDNFCQPRNYAYERDTEQKEGLAFDIYKTPEEKEAKSPSARIHYKNRNKVSVAGKDGKIADYDVFKGLTDDAKRLGKKVGIDPEGRPEFVSKMKLACLASGVEIGRAPEGKIDISSFETELSDAEKALAQKYNEDYDKAHQQEKTDENKKDDKPADAKEDEGEKSYGSYLKNFEKDLADGKEIDISALSGDDKSVAYAAALVAASKSENKDTPIKGAPENIVDYTGVQINEDEAGNKSFNKRDMPEELKNLPNEALSALQGHNSGIRSKQIETIRAKMTPEQQTARSEIETKREEKRSKPGMSRNDVLERLKAKDNSGRS